MDEVFGRDKVGLELVSVDATIVRAHQESAGLAIAGETLDALEQALTEETRVRNVSARTLYPPSVDHIYAIHQDIMQHSF